MALRSRLGKAAVIGGRDHVVRYVTSDDFAAIFAVGLDPRSRREILDLVARLTASAPPVPTRKPVVEQQRIKLRWSDDLIARFTAEASRTRDNKAVLRALGLPACCEAAMRRARGRYLRNIVAPSSTPFSPRPASSAPGRPPRALESLAA
jgi:hypothetical protein